MTDFTKKEINNLREAYFIGSMTPSLEIFENKFLDCECEDMQFHENKHEREFLEFQRTLRKIGFITLDDEEYTEEYEIPKKLVDEILKDTSNSSINNRDKK